MHQNLIQLENVSKVYPMGTEDVHALRDVSVSIEEEEFVSIMGPSGGGKSTMLNMVGCLDRPSSGEVILGDVQTSRLNDSQLARFRGKEIGFIFQTFNLYPILNVLKNVELPMIIQNISPTKRRKRAEELLSEIGLGDRVTHMPSELSGGERQRVAIARALANDPAIILADEPTGNLDSKVGKEVLNIFKELNEKGRTIVTVTHDTDVANMADRILKMIDGKLEVFQN